MEQYALYTHQFELADGYSYRSEIIGSFEGAPGLRRREFSKEGLYVVGRSENKGWLWVSFCLTSRI